MNEQLLNVQGLSGLLRAVAGRVQGDVDGLNMQLLLQSAEQLDNLEVIAGIAEMIVDSVPRSKGRSRRAVKVDVVTLADLASALRAAGKRGRINV